MNSIGGSHIARTEISTSSDHYYLSLICSGGPSNLSKPGRVARQQKNSRINIRILWSEYYFHDSFNAKRLIQYIILSQNIPMFTN
jgi:hypothetical protein